MKVAFLGAIEVEPAARPAWLREHCPATVREEVRALVRRYGDDGGDGSAFETTAWNLMERHGRTVGAAAEPEGPPTALDGFRIVRELGTGGMGTVYEAEDTTLDRRVALKVLAHSASLSTAAVERFRQEAITVARLRHPNIVPVFRTGHAGGAPYIVMELVDGTPLSRLIARWRAEAEAGHAPNRDRAWITEQVRRIASIADALEHAHARDVIHRDVKPSNVIVADDGARLADFGIAKDLAAEGMTMTGQLAGTIAYMSPEQARGARDVDARSDVFSLGASLYEVLTLRPPFEGDDAEAIRRKVIDGEPTLVRTRNPAVPPDLAVICHTALEKDPARRYASAAAMRDDLERWLDGRPILARPPSALRRAREWVRQHRRRLAASAMIVLALAAVTLAAMLAASNRRGTVDVLVEAPRDWSIQARVLHAQSGEVLDSIRLGRAPIRRRLDPGLYRFDATIGDDGRSEGLAYVPQPSDYQAPTVPPEVYEIDLTPGDEVRPPDEDDMILVPAGTFQMPSPDGDAPALPIEAFWIDRCEVTNAEYQAFLDATGRAPPIPWRSDPRRFPDRFPDHPVVGIFFEDATAYAHWKGKRLPTYAEWLYAMSYPDRRHFPWGDGPYPGEPPSPTPEDIRDADSDDLERMLEVYEAHVVEVDSNDALETELGIRHANSNVSEFVGALVAGRSGVFRAGANWTDDESYRLEVLVSSTWQSWNPLTGFRCVRRADE